MIGFRQTFYYTSDRCFRFFPCLSDPGRRSALLLQSALVLLHLVYAGILFLFDKDLIEKTIREPWYTTLYILLFVATLAQYFLTAYTSPSYVIDAMREANQADSLLRKSIMSSNKDNPSSSKNKSVVITVEGNKSVKNAVETNASSWTKLVMDLYPPGTSARTLTCSYCNILQPPRSKHCHDCDKCVLQFDHHCVWLGTCIGQGNHCRFWWYIFEETTLCIWTSILYITFLKENISKAWWTSVILIALLIILAFFLIFLLLLLFFHSYMVMTNQTTYELVKRRRIPYLRGIPGRVYLFSKGVCRNVHNFCCVRNSRYRLEALPSSEEIEEKSKPYTCMHVLSCRCCFR
ncbi:protein S-acyltransferase 10 isoform X2 [Impatiens glandulifera]|uniref:protein S-acyltransferase 10 isoform X2 n=1 Tax=Impatiens glandulifera TaxID=253017 RepID=UPI001FB0A38B|nr:protein S-acyltransferase 10 isoform X2 [Impatiens glandulifera]